jgi:hypothetical protein
LEPLEAQVSRRSPHSEALSVAISTVEGYFKLSAVIAPGFAVLSFGMPAD